VKKRGQGENGVAIVPNIKKKEKKQNEPRTSSANPKKPP